MGRKTSKTKEITRLRAQVVEKDSVIELMKDLLTQKELQLQLKAAENAELRASVDELERKWRDAQSEIAEMNIMHSLRRQSAQAGQSGLRMELEMARQNLELYENLTAGAKLRELEQKRPAGVVEQIKRCMSLNRPKALLRKSCFRVKESDHAKRLQEVNKELVNKVLARDVAAIMYERGALTLDELESVQSCRLMSESAKNLVDIIASLPYENYECFLSALKLADQEDIYLWLAYKDYNINVEHTETIRQHYIFLREGLDMKCSSLLAELSAVEVLNAGEKDEIEAQPYMWQQNERLLSVLSRKSAEQFEMFLCALDRSGQKHIADRLREKPDDYNNNNSTTILEDQYIYTIVEQQESTMQRPLTPPRTKKDSFEKPHIEPSPPPPAPKPSKPTTLAPPLVLLTSATPLASPLSPLPTPPMRSVSKSSFGDSTTNLEDQYMYTIIEQQETKRQGPLTPPRTKKDSFEKPQVEPSPPTPAPKPSKPTTLALPPIVLTSATPLASPSSPPPTPPPPKRSVSKSSFGDDGSDGPSHESRNGLSLPLTNSCPNICSQPSPTEYSHSITVDVVCVLVGDPDVDKTNLLLSFLYPSHDGGIDYESHTKVEPNIPRKLVPLNNVTYNLLLKDTTGHEEFDRLRILSYHSADVFVVCFSVVKSSSFDNVRDKWIPELRQHCPHTPLVLVGTQKELRDASSSTLTRNSSYQQFASKNNAKYLECSTSWQEGVDEVFKAAVESRSPSSTNKKHTKFRLKLLKTAARSSS